MSQQGGNWQAPGSISGQPHHGQPRGPVFHQGPAGPQFQAPPQQGYGMPYPYPGDQLAQPQPSQQFVQAPLYYGPRDPMTGEPLSDKSKIVAGLLQLFLGTLGVGRFYIGDSKTGAIQLGLTVFGWMTLIMLFGFFIICGVGLWAFIDAIMMFAGAVRDPYGRRLS